MGTSGEQHSTLLLFLLRTNSHPKISADPRQAAAATAASEMLQQVMDTFRTDKQQSARHCERLLQFLFAQKGVRGETPADLKIYHTLGVLGRSALHLEENNFRQAESLLAPLNLLNSRLSRSTIHDRAPAETTTKKGASLRNSLLHTQLVLNLIYAYVGQGRSLELTQQLLEEETGSVLPPLLAELANPQAPDAFPFFTSKALVAIARNTLGYLHLTLAAGDQGSSKNAARKALDQFLKAVPLSEKNPYLWSNAGVATLFLGNYDKALKTIKHSVELARSVEEVKVD